MGRMKRKKHLIKTPTKAPLSGTRMERKADPDYKQFWQDEHCNSNSRCMSTTNPNNVFRWFGMPHPTSNQIVLDIGVGTGEFATHCNDWGITVDCLDIAPAALSKVEQVARHGYLSAESLPANEYDVAIAMFVTQHVADNNLIHLITQVRRSLKRGGKLYIQFPTLQTMEPSIVENEGKPLEICRPPKEALSMLENRGLQAKEVGQRLTFPHVFLYFMEGTKP